MMSDITPVSFQTLLGDMRQTDVGYLTTIPVNWRQGRTAYGGVTAGLSLEAARRSFPDLPPLRSAMINFVGPVPESPVFTATILRQGRNVTFVRVDGFAGEDVISSITFVFAASRESVLAQDLPAPHAPTPEDTPNYIPEKFRRLMPPFLNNFELRLIEGGRPMTGHDEGLIRVWARHLDPASHTGTVNFLTIGDVLAPAAAPLLKSVTAISSINWTVNSVKRLCIPVYMYLSCARLRSSSPSCHVE